MQTIAFSFLHSRARPVAALIMASLFSAARAQVIELHLPFGGGAIQTTDVPLAGINVDSNYVYKTGYFLTSALQKDLSSLALTPYLNAPVAWSESEGAVVGTGSLDNSSHLQLGNDGTVYKVASADGTILAAHQTGLTNVNGISSALVSGLSATTWISTGDGSVYAFTFATEDLAGTTTLLPSLNLAGKTLADFYVPLGGSLSAPHFIASAGSFVFDYATGGSLVATYQYSGATFADVALDQRLFLSGEQTLFAAFDYNGTGTVVAFDNFGAAAIPEPSTAATLLSVAALILVVRRRMRCGRLNP